MSTRCGTLARRAFLAVLVLFAFGLLPVLGESHGHAGDPDHQACQLCLVASQAWEPPAPQTMPAPAEIPLLDLPAPASDPALPTAALHDSRGPPRA